MSRRLNLTPVRLLILCLNLTVFLFALVLTGCSGSPPKKRGIKLSEASEEAKKKPEDQEPLRKKKKKGEKDDPVVPDDDDDDSGIGIGIGIIGFDSDGSDAYDDEDLRPPSEKERLHVGVVVGGGSLGKNELDGFALFGIQIGPDFFEKRLRVDLRGLVMPTNQTENAQATSGLDDELEIAGGHRWALLLHARAHLYGPLHASRTARRTSLLGLQKSHPFRGDGRANRDYQL
ncbi:MAG: hypothetical protein V3V49_02820 [Candidatus Krumholzibacteria bacterium]